MNRKELEAYEYQLQQVRESLHADPDNTELRNLESELADLVQLTRKLIQQDEDQSIPFIGQKKSDSIDTFTFEENFKFKPGQECSARWVSGDKSWYPAKITSITGSSDNPVYVVSFIGYKTTDTVMSSDVKPLPQKKRTIGDLTEKSNIKISTLTNPTTPTITSPILNDSNISTPAPKKKKVSAAAKETIENQKAWQSFAAKGGKKKTMNVINQKSIFKTPDNIHGKVGVVGSGQGMTEFKQRGRHIFQKDD